MNHEGIDGIDHDGENIDCEDGMDHKGVVDWRLIVVEPICTTMIDSICVLAIMFNAICTTMIHGRYYRCIHNASSH